MNNNDNPLKDKMILYGLFAFAISLIIFVVSDLSKLSNDNNFGLFFANYVFTSIYTFAVIIAAFARFGWSLYKSNIQYTIIMLMLWLISAFALNREMNVFEVSVLWLCIYISMFCTAIILSIFNDYLPKYVHQFIYFIIGAGLVLFIYYSFYLVPLYFISIPAAIGLGFSLHSFVPLCIVIICSIFVFRNIKTLSYLKYPFFVGISIPLILSVCFVFYWNKLNNQILEITNQNTLAEGKLPAWVAISQKIPKNLITEKIIKADLVYKTYNEESDWFFGGFNNRSFDEPKKHDPLVVLASLFSGKPNIDEKEKIKILEAIYDSRHQAQERLWAGDKLETFNLTNNIKIFPEYRIAYTEKIINIRNNDKRTWSRDQEAIYTFHLTEGAVVSSLSLWIEGKEEKAYLTTKSKADSAYKQIVGVERRDPSVIHWQEGNTVSVRVFPCTTKEDRKFKIGISSPLKKSEGKLIYENIYFDGPNSENANETLQLSFSKIPSDIKFNDDLNEISNGVWQINRQYNPNWSFGFNEQKLSSEKFSFDKYYYQLKNYTPKYVGFNADNIYLDLNSSWTKNEFDLLWNSIQNKNVYVFENEIVKITDSNKDEIFNRMNLLNYSLFPIYKIETPEKSLLISKSDELSPNLSDLNQSVFIDRLKIFLKESSQIRIYNLNGELSPYLKSLKEFRVFNYDHGSIHKLNKLLKQNKFIQSVENEDKIVINNAELTIERIEKSDIGSAPDHLLRLFAYNHIMKKVGKNYFDENYVQPDIIEEAELANIVTPVSSLIVLETVKDYERFDIEKSKNSLQNASMKSSGAVPEPHEWLLMTFTALVVLYLIKKQKHQTNV